MGTSSLPAVLGGEPLFAEGLSLVRPTLPDSQVVLSRFDTVLRSGQLTNGPNVRALEAATAEYLGVRHVVAVSSCTSGLMLTLQGCGADGPVVMPAFTFSATAHAAHWAGGTPVFGDVDADTLTLDPAAAEKAVEGASALMATHLYGTPCDTEGLQATADRAGVPLVYDAAHALGSRRRGRLVGGFGAAEVFSLSPTKVTVAGEGGLVTTDDDAIAEHVRSGRDYGNPGDYDCRFPGLNARMSEFHAVLALASLAGLEDRVAWRHTLVKRFQGVVGGLPGLTWPAVRDGDRSTYKDLALLVDVEDFGMTAARLGEALRAEGVDYRHYYQPPVHRQKAYAGLPRSRPLPVTDRVAEQVICPPLWSHMTEQQVDRLGTAIVRIQGHADAIGAGR